MAFFLSFMQPLCEMQDLTTINRGAKYQKQGVSTWAWHITTINKYGMIGKSENAAPKTLPVQNT